MMPAFPYIPDGYYHVPGTHRRAGVYYVDLNLSSEIRVCWVSDDSHTALNEMLGCISVLELDHLVTAAIHGETFTIDALEDLFPRPGWLIDTQLPDDPSQYALQEMDTEPIYYGSRQDLLLLLELAIRSALAVYINESASREWIQRLRDVHPKISTILAGNPLFMPEK
jgi:hypothetical protein